MPDPPAEVARRLDVSEERLAGAVARGVSVLYEARARRVWPARDEKILAGWNGLMLRAVAVAARAFGEPRHRQLAVRNGELLLGAFVRDGRVLRIAGAAPIAGVLEDHAAVALGFLELYELTFEDRWLNAAGDIADAVVRWFWDDDAGAFFDTASDAEALITRPREVTDNATPSGTSLTVELMLRLAELHHDSERRRRANWVLETLAEAMAQHGLAFGHLLGAADLAVHGAVEVALVGDPAAADHAALAAEVGRHYLPDLVMAGGAPGQAGAVALLADRPMDDGRATAYVCRHYSCDAPVTDPERLREQLDRATAAG